MSRAQLWLVAVASFVAAVVLAPPARAEELYLRLNQGELFLRCGIEVKNVTFGGWPGRFAGGAVGYEFGEPVTVYANEVAYGPGYVEHASVAVYSSVDDARRAFDHSRWIVPMAPPPPPEGQPIGDEMQWSYSREGSNSWGGATITWRRRNVVFTLRKRAAPNDVVALARQIDAFIRDDRQIAPLGRFAETPEIVSVGAPERIVRGTTVRLSPVFRGLGPVKNLRIRVRGQYVGNDVTQDGKSDRYKLVRGARPLDYRVVERTPEEDGRFELSTWPEAPLGPDQLIMVVATPDNVIVGKVFTITVTDE